MAAFLRIAAVLVGLGNLLFMSMAPSNRTGLVEIWPLEIVLLLLLLLVVVVLPALLSAEILLRLARRFLEGGFVARYVACFAGVWLGGIFMGAWYLLLVSFASAAREIIEDPHAIVGWSGDAVGAAFIGAFVGGTLGAVEGLVIAFPLAALLGLFRRES